MGTDTKIQWTHHTFNPVEGCEKISPGCKNCYAEARNHRLHSGENWGPGSRHLGRSENFWKEPVRWNRLAGQAQERHRVFCASLADVFEDHPDWPPARMRLWKLISETQNLDWLLLTKRPENFARFLPWMYGGISGKPWPNVWLGVTAEDQEHADKRIPILMRTPAVIRFASVEPQLEHIDLKKLITCGVCHGEGVEYEPHANGAYEPLACHGCMGGDVRAIDWVICGGESGDHARPFHLDWMRSLRDQCIGAGVSFFAKQLGRVPVIDEDKWRAMSPTPLLNAHNKDRAPAGTVPIQLFDKKGGDWDKWPGDLRYRNFPQVRS